MIILDPTDADFMAKLDPSGQRLRITHAAVQVLAIGACSSIAHYISLQAPIAHYISLSSLSCRRKTDAGGINSQSSRKLRLDRSTASLTALGRSSRPTDHRVLPTMPMSLGTQISEPRYGNPIRIDQWTGLALGHSSNQTGTMAESLS